MGEPYCLADDDAGAEEWTKALSMRFDIIWTEELWVYECQEADKRGRERVVTDGEW
jgi:hypothetical protein